MNDTMIWDIIKTELPDDMASRIIHKIQETVGGRRIYLHTPPQPRANKRSIADDWESGLTLNDIMQKHRVSRRTAYRYKFQ